MGARRLAPRARFELATLRLTAEAVKNLSALSGVAYKKLGVIFPSLVAPNPAPKYVRSRASHSERFIFASHANSLLQANPPLDFLKPGIVSKLVELGPYLDENEMGIAIFTGLLKRLDRRLLLSKTVINDVKIE
jgi:hypothetical protein